MDNGPCFELGQSVQVKKAAAFGVGQCRIGGKKLVADRSKPVDCHQVFDLSGLRVSGDDRGIRSET